MNLPTSHQPSTPQPATTSSALDALAEVRATIRHTEDDRATPHPYYAPWDHQQKCDDALWWLRQREARILQQIAADEAHTAELAARAQATGNPALAVLAYCVYGPAVLPETPDTGLRTAA